MRPQQIELVRRSWQQVLPIRAAAADLFYARLFELAPDVRPLFRRDIHAQGAMLMATLSTVVEQLDTLDRLLPTAAALAQRHVTYGVRAEHYDSVGTALLWTLGQGLGQAFTRELQAAWAAAYAALAGAMKQAAYPTGPSADHHAGASPEPRVSMQLAE
jgi:hemoglobin-like flavoprotein